MKIIRQGDVVLQSVKSIPSGAVEVKTEDKRVVLAYGEVTGHAHAASTWRDELTGDSRLKTGVIIQKKTLFSRVNCVRDPG